MARAPVDSTTDRGLLDRELTDLPPEVRWREWMGRVEAAIFSASAPVERAALAELVGRSCVIDDLIADIRDELKARPYDLADAIRAARGSKTAPDKVALTKTEHLVVTAIAYLQPVTRAALSSALGRDISRDTIALLKRRELVGAGPRMAQPGAPLTYVTTPGFLSLFGLGSLRDLPDVEAMVEAGLADRAIVSG
jgi:segregation and condensation protein B